MYIGNKTHPVSISAITILKCDWQSSYTNKVSEISLYSLDVILVVQYLIYTNTSIVIKGVDTVMVRSEFCEY